MREQANNNYSNRDDGQLTEIKIPPHSDEAEEAVVGGLLIDNKAWDDIVDILSVGDFYQKTYRLIFAAIESLANKFQPCDQITVINALREKGVLNEIGGEEVVMRIAQRAISSANIKVYAQLVRDKAILRQLIHTSSDIAELGYFPGQKETKDLLDEAEQKIFAIADQYQANTRDDFVSVARLSAKAIRRIQELAESDSHITGLPTGWRDLDEKTSGLQKGDLIIVAARPAMGKTAFCLNIAANVAISQKVNVAIFSLEMPGDQLVTRFFSMLGDINQKNLRTGKLSKSESERLNSPVTLLQDAPIFIDDNPGLSPTELRAKCRRLVRERGELGLIIVDYLQLMEVRGSKESRVNQVSEISRSLKMLAKEFDCPVIALSQLSRNVEQRQGHRPVMSDLRESGAIEQDADVVMFIYRKAAYATEGTPDYQDKTAEIIIGKQRNGPIGDVKLTFIGEFTKFEDYSYRSEHDIPPEFGY